MERMNGCRKLGCYSVVCSGFVELIRFESPMVCCDEFRSLAMPLMGCPTFPFIDQGKVWVIVEGKEEDKKEKKSSRIARSFSFTWVPPTL